MDTTNKSEIINTKKVDRQKSVLYFPISVARFKVNLKSIEAEENYLYFPVALKQRWSVHIQLEFATIEHSGLLLFNGRHNGEHDFISILVIKGQVQLIFSIFSQTITVTTNVNGGVADGRWHKVEVSFHKRVR